MDWLPNKLRDLNERFRCEHTGGETASFLREAAEEIERLREALEFYADPAKWRMGRECDPNSSWFTGPNTAREALSAKTDAPTVSE